MNSYKEFFVTHGILASRTREYKVWSGMKARCYNPRHDMFKHYGGRGISVCGRWMSFLKFFEDMGHRPSEHHSIERIDNNGNYEPSNCMWATPPAAKKKS